MQPASASIGGPAGSARFRPDPAALAKADDADRVVSGASGQLNYLSQVSVSLGLPDPVQEYFGPIVGRWRDLHEQATRWRRAAAAIEELAEQVTTPLGALDTAWQGTVSDSFIAHMRHIGKASTSASDAMATMAEVLDKTAEAMHELVCDTVDLLTGGAGRVSMAMILPIGGEFRASTFIAELHAHGRRLLEAVRELLEAFGQVLNSLDATQPFAGVTMATTYPQQNWTFQPDLPTVPPPAAAEPAVPDASPAASAAGFGGGGGGGFGGGGGGGFGGAAPPLPAAAPEPAIRTFAAEPGTAGTGAGQPAAASSPVAGSGGARGAAGGMGAGMMPMMGAGAGQGGDNERKSNSNLTVDPTQIFGEPSKTVPPVIGEE